MSIGSNCGTKATEGVPAQHSGGPPKLLPNLLQHQWPSSCWKYVARMTTSYRSEWEPEAPAIS